MNQDLSIAVVTRKRHKLLEKCLASIVNQSKKAVEVIVVDNDQDRSSEAVVLSFQHKLPIRYVLEPKKGISYARNKALAVTKTRYLGFVDDDCILNSNWIREGFKGISKLKSAYVVGETKLLNNESYIARTRFFYYKHWFKTNIEMQSKRINGQGLDTKNVIFDTEVLKKFQIKFDLRYAETSIGGGEDIDIGLQLKKQNLRGYYVQKMWLQHREPDKIWQLLSKAYWCGRASCLLSQKWKLEEKYIDKQNDWRIWWEDFWLQPYTNKIFKNKFDFKKLWSHLLIKLYDRIWIEGYTDQRSMKVK